MRVLPIIVVGSSTLSTTFAQSPSSYRPTCSTNDQRTCCEMTSGKFNGANGFCSDHGCSQNGCSAKLSGYGGDSTWSSGVKSDDWGSGGISKWGKVNDDVWSASKTTSWSWGGGGTSLQWGDWGAGWVSVGVGHPTSRPRSRQQRRLRGHQFRATLSQRPTTHQQLTHHQPPSLTMVHQFRATPNQTPTTHQQLTHYQPPSLTIHHRRRQLPRLLKLVAQVVKTSAQRNSPC